MMTKRIVLIDLEKFNVKWLLYIVLYFSLFYRFLCDYLGVPSAARFLIDFILIFLLFVAIVNKKKINSVQKKIIQFLCVFFLYSFITYLLNYQSSIYLLYGFFFQYRYYLFFVLCIIFFNEKDVEHCLKGIDVLFYLNTIFVFIQYFEYGLFGDYLGGIFGYEQGCNAYLNSFLVVVLVIEGFNYLNKHGKLSSIILKLFISLSIAAIAELKIFFIEFIILMLFAIFFTGFSWKKVLISVLAVVGLISGYAVFSGMYSYAGDFLNIDTWIKLSTSSGYSSGYSGTGEVNRLTFISVINDRILTTPFQRMLGLGLGNCSFSGSAIFNTPFYKLYSSLRYEWFTSSHLYLEQGYIGIFLFLGFFVNVIYWAQRLKKNLKERNIVCYYAQTISIIAFILFIYNNSLTSESGFLLYFMVSLPFIKMKTISRNQASL